jgi:hypothetical protein
MNAIILLNINLKIDLKVAALLEISFRIYYYTNLLNCIGYKCTKVDKQTGYLYIPFNL